MAELLQRLIAIPDLHYPNNSGSFFSKVEGTDFRNYPSPNPNNGLDRMDLLFQKLEDEIETETVDLLWFMGDITSGDYSKEENIEFRDTYISPLDTPYYVSYGNHDRLTDEEWTEVYGHPRSHAFELGDYGYINLNSSNESGSRSVCLDALFLKQKLEEFEDKKGVFIFSHIPRFSGGFRGDPRKDSGAGNDSPECTEIMEMVADAPNVICMVHGHFHEFNNIVVNRGVPCVFTGHFAHYGMPYFNIRIFEIYDDGSVFTRLVGFSSESKQDGRWQYKEHKEEYYNLSKLYRRHLPKNNTIRRDRIIFNRFGRY